MNVFTPEGTLQTALPKGVAALQDAMQQQTILEARAICCDSVHNLLLDIGGIRGIIPKNEGALGIAEGTTRDIAIIARVNKPVQFVIQELHYDETDRPYALLSRKAVQQTCINHYLSTLRPGDVIPGRITHLEPFGCFVDIGCGIVSLLPIDAISVSRISHPSDRFSVGQDIQVIIKQIDENGKILLSHKELLGTWAENASLFEPGETVSGIVRSIESYGIFIELTPNLAGLAEPRSGVVVGQHASVFIKSMLSERMKVKLVIVDHFDADYPPVPPKYFTAANHISRFCYSPSCSSKVVETIFE